MKEFEFEDKIVIAFYGDDTQHLCFVIPSFWSGHTLARFKTTYRKEIQELKEGKEIKVKCS